MAANAEEHELAGARLFREERYAAALVEFDVAQRLGAKEAAWYRAASLVQLRRPEEAIEVFAEAHAVAPRESDALLDYYEALGLYQAKLYLSADALLAGLKGRAGPRIVAQAQKIRGDIAAALAVAPTREAIDWYMDRAANASARKRTALYGAYLSEASLLALRRPDAYRHGEARAALVRMGAPGVPPPAEPKQ